MIPSLSSADTASGARRIQLSAPHLAGHEWAYVKECLDSGWVSSAGAFVPRFEQELASRVGVRRAVATSNGTAALHIALLVAGVEPDDEVLVSTLTFIAPANAVRYVGAWPIFVDAEPGHWQMDAERVVAFVERQCSFEDGVLRNRITGRRVRAILPVHILGHLVDVRDIVAIARKYELPVIEDATESLGASYRGETVGRLGDIACLSFNGNKIITTGGGGAILTDNDAWAERARYLTTQAKDESLEHVHGEVGYNYRLTNIQAALRCAQLEQLDRYVEAKRASAAAYTARLALLPGLVPMKEAPWASSTFWMYTVLIVPEAFGLTSRDLLRHLADAGIEARLLWQPLHLSRAHAGGPDVACQHAERLYRQALSLPCSVALSHEDREFVIDTIVAARERVSR